MTMLTSAGLATAAPASTSTTAPPAKVDPTAERSVTGSAKPFAGKAKPGDAAAASASSATAGAADDKRNPKLSPEMRQAMAAKMSVRVDRDLVQVKSLRGEAVDLLQTFVNESPKDTPDLPEALIRLGELRWEMEREAFVQRFQAWERRPVDQRGPAPEPQFGPSRELFQRVLADYPSFPEYDLALYVDGFLANEQGKEEEALARFSRIIAEFPRSRFLADAHMAKAEALFEGKYDYAGALVEYNTVLTFKTSADLYGIALFKSAWCLWRLGQSDEAAKRFVKVFEVTDDKAAPGTRGPGDVAKKRELDELANEALKYLVEVFTEDEKNSASDVYAFLTKIGGDRFAARVVRALAQQFYDQSHYERGIEAYELLLKLEPTSPRAGEVILSIADGYDEIEDYKRLETTYKTAVTQYLPGQAWSRTQADPAVVQAARTTIEDHLRQSAMRLHARAQKDKTSLAEYQAAAGLYKVYLGAFAKEPHAYEMHYNLGEIELHHTGDMGDAATNYLAAARLIPDEQARTEPLKSLRHDALYDALAALERQRTIELEGRPKNAPATAAGQAESDTDKKFAEALDLYAELYPNDPALPELLFRQGRLYYDHGVYDPAVQIWGNLVERFPRSQYAAAAGELILDSFNRAKDYGNIETWARRLKTAPAFSSPTEQAKLSTLIVQAVFKRGESESAKGDHAAAAASYLRAAKEFPGDARAAQACVNAELEAQKAGDVVTLRAASSLALTGAYRDRPEAPLAAWTAAGTFQAMGLLGDAAELDEALVTNADRSHPAFARFEHRKDAAYNAVVLRQATGESDRAVADGNAYLRDAGGSADADEVVFLMGRAEENAGHPEQAATLYRKYLAHAKNVDHRVEGYLLLAQAQLKIGAEHDAEASLKDAVALGKRSKGQLGPDGKAAAAHARYLEGERVMARFDKVQIAGDVKQLARRLKDKAALLKEAASIFLDVVPMGSAEWSTASLYQTGHAYESFAKSLRDSPPPDNLSAADKEAFSQQIEEFVVPIEERALDAYESGWKKAIDLGIYNQWTAKMREALGRLNAELYPPLKEVGFEVRSQGTSPLPALIEAPQRGVTGKDEATKGGPTTAAALPATATPATTPAKATTKKGKGR
jgi:tetratricopeptide (TPR) repeat protein